MSIISSGTKKPRQRDIDGSCLYDLALVGQSGSDQPNGAVFDKRKHLPCCSHCKDVPSKNCIHCACCVVSD